jgi:hypothetical protein
MVDLTDNQIDAALARGQANRRREPRATKVWYEAALQRVFVELENGRAFNFPSRLAQGLEAATDGQLRRSKSWATAMACIGRRWTWTSRLRA